MRGWLALGVMVALGGTAQAAERRELAPHEHGRSKLNLAVEGAQVIMEIEAPGMDVLGFEYPAQTAEEKAAVKRLNKAALEDVVYAPTGFFLSYTAWRKNISGIAKGPLPFFWSVSKTA